MLSESGKNIVVTESAFTHGTACESLGKSLNDQRAAHFKSKAISQGLLNAALLNLYSNNYRYGDRPQKLLQLLLPINSRRRRLAKKIYWTTKR